MPFPLVFADWVTVYETSGLPQYRFDDLNSSGEWDQEEPKVMWINVWESGLPDYLFADENGSGSFDSGEEQITWMLVTNSSVQPLYKFADIDHTGTQAADEPVYDIHSDSDGLTNAQEDALGTSLTSPDTDADGLRDDDEAITLGGSSGGYSPLDWDTNDDGYTDHDQFYGSTAVNYNWNSPWMNGWTYSDWDGDGLKNHQDNWPMDPNNGGNPDPDTDLDGYPDSNDSDPSLNYLWDDWNRNGTNDSQEGAPPDDSDGDGIPDSEDPYPNDPYNGDADQDGLLDAVEPGYGANPALWDTDGDGLPDGAEVAAGTSCGYVDTDHDGLTDHEELVVYVSAYSAISPLNKFSLHPVFSDYLMVDLTDSDNDDIPDRVEIYNGLDPNWAGDGAGDLDGNGFTNAEQYAQGINPNSGNTAYDQDGDGMTNIYEIVHSLKPN